MKHLTTAKLEAALIELEISWAAAESARIAAVAAADEAWELAKSVRDNWKREDGDAICDLAVRVREIAVQARSRAKLTSETRISDEFVKTLIRHHAELTPGTTDHD